ncbi:MAG: ABC transporter ATP-binding protein [Gemmatimonadota bacterium]|nr:MAG: ABC transporter ATP-binding protein [Gemmatimonadota bacterium]
MSLVLEIANLAKTYPNGVRALRDVSLTIPTGMFGLLGPNGAGKSTLMRTVATLQEPDEGTITMGGLDVLKEKEEVRKILGYLPQEFGVYPKVTAQAMLNHMAVLKGITGRGDRKDAVEGLLHQTNLWAVRKTKLGTFSGGMRQRFGIAQALLGDPRLIIVDEPTAGLDPEERLRFLNLLSEIGQNIVVILSTHIVEDVSDLCSAMAIISEGQVLLTGTPGDAMGELSGKVWRKVIQKEDLTSHQETYQVISTHLWAGKTVLHVYAESLPDEGFEAVEGDLKDVYFTTLKRADQPVAA